MLPDYQMRQRILILENSLYKTGAFATALYIAGALRDHHHIEFVLPSTSTLHDEVNSAGFNCYLLPMTEVAKSWQKLIRYIPMLVLNALKLRRLLSRQEISVLIVNDYYNLLGVCVRLAGWRGVILTLVQVLPANQHPMMNWVWTRLGLFCTNQLVAVSHAVARQLPLSAKVSVLYNPIDFSERHPPAKERMDYQDNLIRCLYPANYIAGKGHDIALLAFFEAWKAFPLLRLRFVGSDMGLEKNRALKFQLALTANKLGIQDIVSIDGFDRDIEMAIKHSDIVLNFSTSESFSVTCVEASAYGRPVIATRCGGPEEVIGDGETGLLVNIGEVSAMADAILKLAASKSLRHEMGLAGRSRVRQRFSGATFRCGFRDLLERCSQHPAG